MRVLKILIAFLFYSQIVSVTAQQNAITNTACPDNWTQRATCGYLTVPANYDQPQGEMLQLAFVILHHPSKQPAADPILFLHGGPGSHTVDRLDTLYRLRYASVLAAGRDIVIFDQRGTGRSRPGFDCPASDITTADATTRRTRQVDDLIDCGITLASQHDLRHFTTAASATDVDVLRRTLGYDRINLWAISYGTRVALEVMRHYPQTLRSVVLDSPYPPEVDLFAQHPLNFDRALSALLAACAADLACDETFPRLSQRLFDTAAALDENPIMLTVSGLEADILLDGHLLLDLTFRMLYNTRRLPDLPQIMDAAARGDYQAYQQFMTLVIDQQTDLSAGVYYAIQCAEEWPFTAWSQQADAWQARPHYAPYSNAIFRPSDYRRICAAFAVEPQPGLTTVISDVPTLLLVGAYDPVTPPAWAQQVARTLDNSIVIELPATAHGATGMSGCAQNLLVSFIQIPEPNALDTACVQDLELRFFGTPLPNPLDPILPDSAFAPHDRIVLLLTDALRYNDNIFKHAG